MHQDQVQTKVESKMTKYAFNKDVEEAKVARVAGKDVGISTKISIEICNFIRGKNVQRVKRELNDILIKKTALPMTRFITDRGHKPGMAAGSYPIKAIGNFLKLIASLESNAQVKGLGTEELVLIHVCAHRASRPMHYGRQRRSEMKRTHVELIGQEITPEKKVKNIKKFGENK